MKTQAPTRAPNPRKSERVQSILDSARTVFCQHGYEQASIAKIANLAGIAEGTIYTYFDSKRALLYEVLRRHYQKIFDDIQQTLPGVYGHGNRLRYMIHRALIAIAGDRDMCGLITREVRQIQDNQHSIVHDLNQHYASLLVQVIKDGIKDGTFRKDTNPAVIRAMIGGGLELIAWSYMVTGRTIDVDEVADSVCRTVLGGIECGNSEERSLGELVNRLESVADRLDGRGR